MTGTAVTTEIDERVEEQRERAQLLEKQLQCECPADCDVEHE